MGELAIRIVLTSTRKKEYAGGVWAFSQLITALDVPL